MPNITVPMGRYIREHPTLKYFFFGGKGGVGKTVFAGAAAIGLARLGRRTLLVSTNAVHNLSSLFGRDMLGKHVAIESVPNLWAYEIDTRQSIERSKVEIREKIRWFLKFADIATKADAFVESATMNPAFEESAMFENMIDLMFKNECDAYVFDTAPTANARRLLGMSKVYSLWVNKMLKSREEARTLREINTLAQHGIKKSDRVFSLLGRVPELYIAALGTLKNGNVFSPLFSAFGPEPIKARMTIGEAKALITTEAFYRRKIEPWRKELVSLQTVFLTECSATLAPDTIDLAAALAQAPDAFEIVRTLPEDMALLHFTSGTTGKPKGAIHVHEAVVAHNVTGKLALDFRPDDVFWCTADPGWITGTSYGIISPLTNGVTMIIDQAEFDAERWYRILQDQKITIWYTAPTAIRMLMKAGAAFAKRFDLSRLRLMASVGEPLNPEAVVWSMEAFGKPFHDNWWQTETGGIMITNFLSMVVKPGSMGRPLPGIEAGIVEHVEGGVREITKPMAMGELALRPGWPSMMRGYLNEEARYKKCFVGGWYLTGDLAMRDSDGYYWFVGRADDVIKSSGHLIGPFEVESALMEHKAVAEAGVIGIPEPTAGQVVKAYVALKDGFTPSEALRKELLGHARQRLGPAVAPKDIAFRQNLPKTRSGKIMRRLLKARELGLPEGDISTLESEER